MKALVDRILQEGFKAQLWWSPLSAVPNSELLREHPDYELLNRHIADPLRRVPGVAKVELARELVDLLPVARGRLSDLRPGLDRDRLRAIAP